MRGPAAEEAAPEMKTTREPAWIRHSHLFGPDEYECSACHALFRQHPPACLKCGAALRMVLDRQEWVDEAEEMEWMTGD